MKRVFGLALLGLALALPAQAGAGGVAPGTWRLTTLAPNGNSETTSWLLKLETGGGKTTATLLAADPKLNAPKLVSFAAKGDTVRLVVQYSLKTGVVEQTFAGRVSKDG